LCLGVDASVNRAAVVWWKSMPFFGRSVPLLTVAVATCSTLLAIAVPAAMAAPATDDQGFVDSTARCTAPNTAAAFGSTATSRVAICKSPSGQFQYRGVRVRDGAKLILPASQSRDGGFVAENDGMTYTLTSSSLVVSAGAQVIREEPMVDYRGPATAASTTAPSTSTAPSTPTATATPTSTAPATPLPPPLPAEAGGTGR
jgi:hypothetical protein